MEQLKRIDEIKSITMCHDFSSIHIIITYWFGRSSPPNNDELTERMPNHTLLFTLRTHFFETSLRFFSACFDTNQPNSIQMKRKKEKNRVLESQRVESKTKSTKFRSNSTNLWTNYTQYHA